MIVIPRLKSIHIKNFKSISEVTIDFPEDKPIILIGENNSGKSNILRAIDLMFGDYHPSYIKMDIQEDFNINLKKNSKAHNIEISIVAEVDDFVIIDEKDNKEKEIKNFSFSCKRGEMPSYYAVTKDKRYKDKHGIKKDQKQKIYAVFINNEETLNYHLSYSSKNTLLSKFTKAFHEKLKRDDDKVKNLVSIYRNIVEQMRGLEEYRKFEDDFKNLSNGVFANMKGFLELDFSCYDPLNYYKNLSMIFRNSNDGSLEPQSFTMLGSGQKKIIMFLLSYCYAKNFKMQENLILLIDEPESNLHPVAQKWFAKKLYEFSKEGLQIVISTHSPYFINLDYIDSIYLLKKNESGTYVVKNNAYSLSEHCRNRGASKSDQSNVIEFYSASSTPSILQGFFAKLVILVEGPTEEMALPIYFQKVGLDLLKEGIEIICVSGKLQIPKWVRLFSAYKIPCYVFFDYDSKENKKKNKSQKKYEEQTKDILVSLGYNTKDVEDIIQDIEKNGKNCSPITIRDKFCVFHDDFEEAMREIFGNSYEEEENKVKKEYCLGDGQKHLVAREVAKRIVNSINDDHRAISIFKKIYEQLTRLIEQSGG